MQPTRNPLLRNANPIAIAAVVSSSAAFAANTTFDWNLSTGGSLNTPGNWLGGSASFAAGDLMKLDGNSATAGTAFAMSLDNSIVVGAISKLSQNVFTLSTTNGSTITLNGAGLTTIAGTNTAGTFVANEAALMSNQNNSSYTHLLLDSSIGIIMQSNLGIGGRANINAVTVNGNITNGSSSTLQLNFRGGSAGTGNVGVPAYNTQIGGSIGATQTGFGGITIQNQITGSGAVNLTGAIGGASGTGAAITISNIAAGTGTGGFNISGAIGQSVSTITQNSTTSITTLSGNNASFGGTITVTSGALSFLKTTAKSGTTTVANGATLGLGVGGATNPFLSGDVDNLFANTLGGLSMDTTSNVGIDTTNGNFTYESNVASSTRGLNKLGGNTLILSGTNAYTGATTITSGTLSVGSIGNGGVAGNLGQATNAATNLVFNGGTLKYTGANATSDRAFTINAGITATIETANNLSFAGATGAATTGSLTKTGSGVLTLTGVNTYGGITRVSAGTLSIANGASFVTTLAAGDTSLSVGNVAGNSLLRIQSGGAGTARRLQVGSVSGATGAIYNQGTLTVNGSANVGNFALGYATGGYGYYRHDTSTTTTVNEIGIATSSNTTDGSGGNGVMDVLQGKVANVGWFAMNRTNREQYSQLNISGGTFELANSATQVGLFMNNSDTQNNKGGHAVINVSGTGSLTSSGTATELDLMRISGTNTTSTAMLGVLNIGSGGTVQTNVIKATQTLGTALVNFHGGTLKANNTGVTLMGGSNIDGAYIYSGGAIVDTNGKDVTISQNLLTPTGDGVSSIPVTASGTGYIGRPVVYLTGGGGTGATAVADFNPTTGEVTGITITNPGTGYTSAPTVTFTGGGGTAPALGTVTFATNTSGGLTKSNTGTLTLSGANTYTGDTRSNAGTLALGHVNALLASTLDMNAADAGAVTFTVSGSNTYNVGALKGSRNLSGNNNTLSIGGNNLSTEYSGSLGNGALTKTGSGTLTLSGANTHGGTTSIDNGTLAVTGSGSINSTSGVTIASTGTFRYNSSVAYTGGAVTNNGGTITGTGPIGVSVTLDSLADKLAPGNSPGIQNYNVGQTWNSFTYQWETNNFTGTTAGTDFDQLGINGALTLTGAAANSYALDVLSLTGTNAAGAVPNFSETSRQWTVLTTTDGISGFNAASWNIVTGGFTSSPTWTGSFSLTADSNNIYLNYAAVPEPSAALLAGLGLLALWRRRRSLDPEFDASKPATDGISHPQPSQSCPSGRSLS